MNTFIIDDRVSLDVGAVQNNPGTLQRNACHSTTAHLPDWDRYSLEVVSKSRKQVQS